MDCQNCNKPFEKTCENRKFCSSKCARDYHNHLRPKKGKKNFICPVCREDFFNHIANSKYCSKECYKIGIRQIRISKPNYYTIKEKKICPFCKHEFTAFRIDKVFCSRKCIDQWRNDRKPRLTEKSYRKAQLAKNIKLTNDQKEIIYGTLLGDASTHIQTDNFHRLSFCHCEKQLEYILFKKQLLSTIFLQSKPNKMLHKSYIFDGRLVPDKIQYHFHSVSHKDITNIRGIFYRNKKKYITRKVLNLLTPTSLLFWHLDDGSLSRQRCIRIHTLSFSLSEHKAIKIWFWQKHRIIVKISTIRKEYNGQNKIYYFLRFTVPETRKLIAVMSRSKYFPLIPQSMRYKVTIRPYKY